MSARKTDHEKVVIVDTDNNIIGSAERQEMRRENLVHRASYILVFNKSGEIFIQKRTKTKDIFPGYWDIAAGGVVQEGESYEESATRELEEELGISSVPLHHCFDHYYADNRNRVWGRVFACTHTGPFTLQEEEIEEGLFLSPQSILSLNRTEPVTPDGLEILDKIQYRDREEKP